MKLVSLGALLLTAFVSAASGLANDGGDDFEQVKKWLVSQGAEVNEVLHESMTSHGGANIRGVVTSSGLAGDQDTTLFKIPKKLWLLLNNFPSFAKADLPITHECEDLASWEKDRLKLAAAIVTESRKGAESLHHTHLQHLPTMRDFQSFLPTLMEEPLQRDFQILPLVDTVKEVQSYEKDYTKFCFDQWQKWSPSSPAASLRWEEMQLALTWIKTRCHGTKAGTAIVPGADMLNVAKSGDLNTEWSSDNEDFFLKTKSTAVKSGQELYESYCQDCDNSAMLKIWGVYMEDNPNPVDKGAVMCSAHKHGAAQKAMEFVLETKVASTMWTSPRCKAAVFATQQGPIRCSLARLTWEYCAEAWGLASASNSSLKPKATLLSHGATRVLSPREDALLVLQSAIRDVPKALRRGRARKAVQGALETGHI